MHGDERPGGANVNARTLHVEPGSLEDLPGILALMRDCSNAPHWPQEGWTQLLERREDAVCKRVLLTAKSVDGELAGWLAASLILDTTELEFVVVDPGRHGLGYGRELLRAWMVWAEERGATEAWLEVRLSNQAALRLYGSLGFLEYGRRTSYYQAPPDDAVVMRLALSGVPQPHGSEPPTRQPEQV